MGAVFFDVVDHGVEVLERSNATSCGNESHVFRCLVFLVLIWNYEFPAAFTGSSDFVSTDLNVGMGLGKEDQFFLSE